MKSFSVIEVLIVLAIISILGMVVVPQLWISEQQIRGETFINNVNLIITNLETYKKQNGMYPLRLEELESYFSDPPINSYTRNSMLSSDEFKAGIRYTVSQDRLSYTLEIVQKDVTDLNRNGDKNETIAEALQRAVIWSTPVQITTTSTITYPIIILTNIPGAGLPSASPPLASEGTTVVLQANANTCYTLVSWTSQDVQIQDNSFIMPSATVTIIGNYTQAIYTILITTVKNGNSPSTPGTVIGAGTYNCGSTATLTAVPATGFTFTGWYESGSQVSTNTTYSFTVSNNRTLEARFAAINYNISFVVNPIGAGSPSASPNPANIGQTITLTANPGSCYNFNNWSTSDVTISGNTFTMPAKNVTITANYSIRTYTITTTITKTGNSPSTPGTVTGAGTYNCGSTATVTAIPNAGFTFVGWYENGTQVSTNTTYSFTVSSNRALEARFAAVNYNISFVVNPTGAGSPSASPNPANVGQTITLTANPNSCYIFDSWSSSDTTIIGDTFTMPAKNVAITANYNIKTYTINASAGTGGTINPSGSVSVNCGSNQIFSIIPNTGYTIDNVIVDGTSIGATTSYTFNNVTSNHTISASFRLLQYSITLSSNPLSAGSPSASPNPANYGQTVALAANPDSCYNFSSWSTSDATLANNTASVTTFIMPAKNVLITANYTIKTYNIAATITKTGNSPDTPGTVTGTGIYNCGSTATLTAVPATGFTFTGWYESGSQVSTNTTYSFTVSSDRALEARFAAVNYNISFVVNPTGAGSPSASPNPANVGQTITLAANPSSCYNFSSWITTDATISSNTFTMPAKNVSITANYMIETYNIVVTASGNGIVSGSGIYNCGATVTLTAIPETGYSFLGWYENGQLISSFSNYSFKVTSNRNITGIFNQTSITITITEKDYSDFAQGQLTNVMATSDGKLAIDLSPQSSQSTITNFNGTYIFNGSNSAVSINSNFGYGANGPYTLTIELLFNTAANTYQVLLGQTNNNQPNIPNYYIPAISMLSNGKMSFCYWSGAAKCFTTAASYNDGRWHSLAYVIGSGTLRGYIDGVNVGSVSGGNPVWGSGSNSWTWTIIGAGYLNSTWNSAFSSNGAWSYFNGLIDDVRIYSDARSLAQIQQDQLSEAVNTTNLLGYYKFNETSGTIVQDSSGNGRNGTSQNIVFYNPPKNIDTIEQVQQAFNSGLNTSYTSATYFSMRFILNQGSIQKSGNRIRLSFYVGNVGKVIKNVSIGEVDNANYLNIKPGTWQMFTFNGSSSITSTTSGIIYTDWLNYTLDNTKSYAITIWYDSNIQSLRTQTPPSNTQVVYIGGVDYTSTQNWSGKSGLTTTDPNFYVFNSIEVANNVSVNSNLIIGKLAAEWYDITNWIDPTPNSPNGVTGKFAADHNEFTSMYSTLQKAGYGGFAFVDSAIAWSTYYPWQIPSPSYLPAQNFAYRVYGYIYAPISGNYSFGIDSDDSGEIIVDGMVVTSWYQNHSPAGSTSGPNYTGVGSAPYPKTITPIYLTQGWHTIEARVEQWAGSVSFAVGWKKPSDSEYSAIPAAFFAVDSNYINPNYSIGQYTYEIYNTSGKPIATNKNNMDNLFTQTPIIASGTTNKVIGWHSSQTAPWNKPSYIPADNYAWIGTVYIYAPVNGTYWFSLDSDDASDLSIDGTIVTSWYGGHSTINTSGAPTLGNYTGSINLDKGWHKMVVRYQEYTGVDGIYVGWKKPGDSSYSLIEGSSLATWIPTQRISPIYDISAFGTVLTSTIVWTASTPGTSNVIIETSLSLDGGSTWTPWQPVSSGANIPGLTNGTNLQNAKLRIRETLNAQNGYLPYLDDLYVYITIKPYIVYFQDIFDNTSSLDNWTRTTNDGTSLPTISIDSGSLYIYGSNGYVNPGVKTITTFSPTNPRNFTIEGDMKLNPSSLNEIWIAIHSNNGDSIRFGWSYGSIYLQGSNLSSKSAVYANPNTFTHVKLVVNGDQISLYVGSSSTPILQQTTPYTYFPGYIRLYVWKSSGAAYGWFDNIILHE